MRYVLLLSLLLAGLLFTSSAQGYEISLKDYENLKNEQEMDVYISGLGTGLESANNRLKSGKQAGLYCPPADTILRTNNFMEILEKEIASLKKTDPEGWQKREVGQTLLEGLLKTFPCKKKKE